MYDCNSKKSFTSLNISVTIDTLVLGTISHIGDELRTTAMATKFGHLQEYHPETEAIKTYLERVSLYFTANSIEDGKKVAVLLSSIGPSTYALLSDLLAPDTPGSKTYKR